MADVPAFERPAVPIFGDDLFAEGPVDVAFDLMVACEPIGARIVGAEEKIHPAALRLAQEKIEQIEINGKDAGLRLKDL